jgi:hypothetical protein
MYHHRILFVSSSVRNHADECSIIILRHLLSAMTGQVGRHEATRCVFQLRVGCGLC